MPPESCRHLHGIVSEPISKEVGFFRFKAYRQKGEKMTDQLCDTKFMQTLERIDRKLRFYAQHLSWVSKIVEADDLFQEGTLKLLERSRIEPEFLDQNDSYVLCYAVWMMKNYTNHLRSLFYKKVADQDDLDHENPEFHYRVNHAPSPEKETMRLEIHQLAEGMPTMYQTLFREICDGFSPEEITQESHISRGTYFWRRERMISVLKKAYVAPLGKKKNNRQKLVPEYLSSKLIVSPRCVWGERLR